MAVEKLGAKLPRELVQSPLRYLGRLGERGRGSSFYLLSFEICVCSKQRQGWTVVPEIVW